MSELTPTQSNSSSEAAFSRLDEFPDDPVQVAKAMQKKARMDEMEAWSEGIGAHVERRAEWHSKVGRRIIESARIPGQFDERGATKELRDAATNRTGVVVNPDFSVEVDSRYPYSGDTPRGGSHVFRSPKNIPRN